MLRAGLEAGFEAGTEIQGEQGVYRIERVLRATAQMSTYQAQETLTGYPVVLKVLSVERLDNWKGLELFERETGVLRQLDHPALPIYLDSFARETEAGPRLYLVMSWKEGASLLERLEAGWRPDEQLLRNLAAQALETLNYLQRFNPPIIHRDLKPGNLILDEAGKLHLVDFGAVQGVLNPDGGSTVVGTFGYMPPEQFSDRCVPASDLYALGATLVHLLTGKYLSDLPRDGLRLDYRKALAQADRPAVSQGLLAWLDRLLLPNPEHRFLSASQALAALDLEPMGPSGDARPGKQAKPGIDRIHVHRRGPQQTIQIAPLPWLPGVVTPLLATSLKLGWCLSLLLLCVSGFDEYQRALWGDFLPRMFGFGGLYAAGAHLLHGRMRTTLSLQPDRIEMLHAWGPLKRRIRGTPTQFLNVRRRFSLLRMAWICQFVDWSGLKHTAGLHLAGHECRRLASLLHAYICELDPGLAAGFAAAAFSGPKDDQPHEWHSIQIALGAASAEFRPAIRAFGEHALKPGLTPCLVPATRYLKRFNTFRQGRGLQISISQRYPYGWYALLLLLWLPLSGVLLSKIGFELGDGLYAAGLKRGCVGLATGLPDLGQLACLGALPLLAPVVTMPALLILLTGAFSLHWLLGRIRAAETRIALQIDDTGLRLLNHDAGGEVRIHPAQMLDLAMVGGWGPRGGELVLATLDGRLHTLSRGLSAFENLALINDLIVQLAPAEAMLSPAFRSCLQHWRPRLDWQRHFWRGLPVDRVGTNPDDERPWRSLIEIRPHGMTGKLAVLLWLSLALSAFGFCQVRQFDPELAMTHFQDLPTFAQFALKTMSLEPGIFGPFEYPESEVLQEHDPWAQIGLRQPDFDLIERELGHEHRRELERMLLVPPSFRLENVIYPQGLVWGCLGLGTGLSLLVWVCFYARVRTQLRIEGGHLLVTTRCFGLRRRRGLTLNRVQAYQQPDILGGSHRLLLCEGKRRLHAGFHLTLGEIETIAMRMQPQGERIVATGLTAPGPSRSPSRRLSLRRLRPIRIQLPQIQESQEVQV